MTAPVGATPPPAIAENAWWQLLAFGIVTAFVGAAVLFWPEATLTVVAVLFGLWLVTAGILRLVGAVAEQRLPTGLRVLRGVVGAALLVAGIFAMTNQLASLEVLVVVAGIFLVVDGIDDLVRGFTDRAVGSRWWAAMAGVLSLLAGVIVIVRPEIGLVFLVAMLGAFLLMIGLVRIVAAFAVRDLLRTT
jgi:uncharacterized membrane protein HdeD (DUF308 family)